MAARFFPLAAFIAVSTLAAGLAACGDSGGSPAKQAVGGSSGGSTSSSSGGTVTPTCTTKTALSAKDYTIVVNIPSDTDKFFDTNPATPATLTPKVTPTTKIAYTVAVPARCPDERFPVVLQSHGYSGTRTIASDFLTNAKYSNTATEETAHFPQINEIVGTLPRKGYIVISYDERGHGDSKPAAGGGYARIIDPEAEVADARFILDWAYDNAIDGGNGAEKLPIQVEANTGIAKDMRLGTIGLSYGGGYQLQLTALDARVDTIVPNGTWHGLMYSLLPGDAMKNGFVGLLCVLALGTGGPQNPAVINTAMVSTTCNLMGPTNANANNIRTRADLVAAGAAPTNPAVNGNPGNQGQPSRPITETEVVDFFYSHGTAYYKNREQNNQPLKAGGPPFKLRSVPALFLQGNRDSLFNMTDSYWNYKYFLEAAANADVHLLTTEGGHMNPFAGQKEGSANCGTLSGVNAVYAWFDYQLKGIASATYSGIPRVCISVADTPGSNALPADAGVTLDSFPVGSLSGTGALPALLASGSAAVNPSNVETNPAFVKVVDVPADGYVIAGIPTVDSITVADGTPGSAITPVAYVGVGIKRGGSTILIDQQVTPFVKGVHTNNRNLNESDNTKVLLSGIGEQLKAGDQVGLVFYCTHVQYQSVISASTGSGASGNGPSAPEGFPAGYSLPNATTCANNHAVSFTNAALPIFKPGTYPNAVLN